MTDLLDGGTPPVQQQETPSLTPVAPANESNTDELYNEALEKLERRNTRIKDLEGEVEKLERDNLLIKKHNRRLLKENGDIADLYKVKCEEDGEALDLGIQADEERKELDAQIKEIAEVLGTEKRRKSILAKIMDLQEAQRKLLSETSSFFQGLFRKGGESNGKN